MSPAFLQTWTKIAWAAALILECTGAFLILKGRLWREIPAFSTYLLYAAVAGVSGVLLFRYPRAYYIFYWSAQVGYKFLNAWVVLEIYVRLMRSFPALRKAAAWTLWSALVIGIIAGLLVWIFAPVPKSTPWEEHVEMLGYSLKMIQLGLLFAVALIVRFFRLQLRRYYTFIAVGIAIIGLGDLSSYALTSTLGYSKMNLINCINLSLNAMGTAVWVFVLLTGEPEHFSTGAYAATSLEELRHWNAALSNLNRS